MSLVLSDFKFFVMFVLCIKVKFVISFHVVVVVYFHVVIIMYSGVLKLYLRELPEPLMTFELYDEWMRLVDMYVTHC